MKHCIGLIGLALVGLAGCQQQEPAAAPLAAPPPAEPVAAAAPLPAAAPAEAPKPAAPEPGRRTPTPAEIWPPGRRPAPRPEGDDASVAAVPAAVLTPAA